MTSTGGEYEKAVQLLQGGRVADAEKIARTLLAQEPRNASNLDLAGTLAHLRGDQVGAIEKLTRAVEMAPNVAGIRMHLGLALRATPGRAADAVGEFRRAVALEPMLAEAHHHLGNTLKAAHRFEEAVQSLSEATRLAPRDAAMWLNLGVAQMELRRLADAVASFRRAIELEPNRAEAHNILSVALLEQGEVSGAEEALVAALKLRPDYAAAHNNLARVYKTAGRMGEAIIEYRAALAAKPDAATHSNLLYALNFMPGIAPADVFAEHRRWAEPCEALWRGKPQSVRERSPARRLRVGFVSPDLVNHAVAYFFESVIRVREPLEWEITVYSDAPKSDHVTQRLRGGCERWRESAVWTDDRLYAQIQEDQIDVLFDLAGHTAKNRLTVFARKAAPIQITWLGYPNTTGLSAMDYRITDDICDPVGQSEAFHSEKLLRLSGGFLCYTPPKESPSVAPVPAASAGRITFGSFSNYAKLSDPCVETWAAVLNRVPNSRLVLKSRGFADPDVIRRVHDRFAQVGLAKERVELDGRLVSVADHLQQYGRIDIALDPFPYNGTTTTCEALWMGVPVVTLAGQTHVTRVGASLLTHISRPEWIANSPDAYVETCARLAGDIERLRQIRGTLRDQMEHGPVCDAPRFTADLRRVVRECWHRYCGAV